MCKMKVMTKINVSAPSNMSPQRSYASLEVHWVRQQGELSTSPTAHSVVTAALTHLFHKNSCDITLRTGVLACFSHSLTSQGARPQAMGLH